MKIRTKSCKKCGIRYSNLKAHLETNHHQEVISHIDKIKTAFFSNSKISKYVKDMNQIERLKKENNLLKKSFYILGLINSENKVDVNSIINYQNSIYSSTGSKQFVSAYENFIEFFDISTKTTLSESIFNYIENKEFRTINMKKKEKFMLKKSLKIVFPNVKIERSNFKPKNYNISNIDGIKKGKKVSFDLSQTVINNNKDHLIDLDIEK